MEKKKVRAPFYCVNSQVLWKDEEAVKNAVLVDDKINQLELDAIFTAASEDVAKIGKVVKRLRIAIDFNDAKPNNLERLKEAGAEVIIFDDLEEIFNIENILDIVKELGYLVLVRTEKPFEIPKAVLKDIDLIKWKIKDGNGKFTISNLTTEHKKAVKEFKQENPHIALIYGAKENISSNLVLNSLIMGLDGFGEINCYRTTTEKREEMLHAVNDYKNVMAFIK
ncbi:hypothetical protein ACFFH2_08880 [Enterococcus devriesei]|uniref:Uncharacterized protein n=1 Tax=Enterococcus devriesei TaxID=319970 RepID=A0A1L8SPZ8_9ENTE|nr:hypothetical protein [Enterococcus devriesei]OJG34116.1 hypothetical protein RV00_GL000928 [Enterococcus devriesei]